MNVDQFPKKVKGSPSKVRHNPFQQVKSADPGPVHHLRCSFLRLGARLALCRNIGYAPMGAQLACMQEQAYNSLDFSSSTEFLAVSAASQIGRLVNRSQNKAVGPDP
ncbi:hypothetical protein CIHG_00580 [Coccidioides immitis H538.4]|uniref:Uncharacterized protein n=1 Tax=Coccidioides immitis H538.4 TaxID=396776 RepID=A0A0J8RD22_COCIT|nr:hypothetical protein CIHG_00580 [Coccidioides immitis H538.4]